MLYYSANSRSKYLSHPDEENDFTLQAGPIISLKEPAVAAYFFHDFRIAEFHEKYF